MKRSIAVISGKGGSGKTMIAAVMASIWAKSSSISHKFAALNPAIIKSKNPPESLILIDGDTGTAGLSYYLGLKYLENFSGGLSQFSSGEFEFRLSNIDYLAAARPLKHFENTRFFGVGNHRLLTQRMPPDHRADLLGAVVQSFQQEYSIIVDCRGGIDEESIAVCREVDDIILIVESDITSFQASQHVVETLTDLNLAHKLKGFIINKAFNDPSVIARNGIAALRCQCLGAIPFDLSAMRSFFVGEIPDEASQFTAQVWDAMRKAYPDEQIFYKPSVRPWQFSEFGQTSVSSGASLFGGIVAASFILIIFISQALPYGKDSLAFFQTKDFLLIFGSLIFGLLGALEPGRLLLGRLVLFYFRVLSDKKYLR
jgi:septum site-determining protein MinD